jgi:hypothetical protein
MVVLTLNVCLPFYEFVHFFKLIEAMASKGWRGVRTGR